MNKFSVIIPTFNRSHELMRAVQSVIEQTFENWEIIIIDDGGNDDTEKVIASYILKYSNISYYKFPNMGASVARNIGIGLSKGEYIAFLDSDDEWSKGRLESVANFIQESPSSLYITDFKSQDKTFSLLKPEYINSKYFRQILLSHNFLGGTINIVVSKNKLIEVGGFDKNLTSSQDHDLYNKLVEVCDLQYVPGEFAIYYLNSAGRISGKNKNKLRGQLKYYKKYKSKMKPLARLLSMKKIALVSYYIRSPYFFKYSIAWLVVKVLKEVYSIEDERDIYLINSKFMNFWK